LLRNEVEHLSRFLIYGSVLVITLTAFGLVTVFIARYLKKKYLTEERQAEEPPFSLEELSEMKKREVITVEEHRKLRKSMLRKIADLAKSRKGKGKDKF